MKLKNCALLNLTLDKLLKVYIARKYNVLVVKILVVVHMFCYDRKEGKASTLTFV